MVVSEDGEIRAIVCSSNEEEVRFKLESLGQPFDGYDISSVFPDSISVNEVVRTAGDGSEDGERRGTKDAEKRGVSSF